MESKQELLPPPTDTPYFHCQKNEKQSKWTDYEQNPFYSELIKSASWFRKIQALLYFAIYALNVFFKKMISYQHIPAHLRKPKSIRSFLGLLTIILWNVIRKLGFKSTPVLMGSSKNLHEILQEQGVAVLKANQEKLDKIEKLVQPLLDDLRRIRMQKSAVNRDFSDSRTVALRTKDSVLFQIVENLFVEHGILDAVSKYIGRRAKLVDINPQINDKTDNFWQTIFPDLTRDLPTTAYYHRDASGGDVKVILYLSDVEADNGPFSYVLASQHSKPKRVINFIQEVNDTSGLSSTTLKKRQRFSALPKFLRTKCAFGNDVVDADVTERILKATWNIVAPRGHMVIFDSKGLHRGSMVLDKERVVITCVLA